MQRIDPKRYDAARQLIEENETEDLKFTLDGKTIPFRFMAAGTSKKVYYIGNGEVIALIDHNVADEADKYIGRECENTRQLNAIGIKTSNPQPVEVKVNGHLIAGIKMPCFMSLLEQGIQVRDVKNLGLWPAGSTYIFGNKANLLDAKHWEKVLKHLMDEVVILISNNIYLSTESLNLAITDTRTTGINAADPGLITDRAQELHLFIFDTTDATLFDQYRITTFNLKDANGVIDRELVRKSVTMMMERVITPIFGAMLSDEVKAIGSETSSARIDLHDQAKPIYTAVWQKHTEAMTNAIMAKLVPIKLNAHQLYVNKLIKDLQAYKEHIDKLTLVNKQRNWSQGFKYFKKSQSINREANYNLATQLISSLEKNREAGNDMLQFQGLFSKHSISALRSGRCFNRVRSERLNTIINNARVFKIG